MRDGWRNAIDSRETSWLDRAHAVGADFSHRLIRSRASSSSCAPVAGWSSPLFAESPAGVSLGGEGVALLVGAALGLSTVLAEVTRLGEPPPIALDRLISGIATAGRRRSPSSTSGGFVPIGGRSVSVVVSAADRELWGELLWDALRTCDVESLVARAQECRIACLPASSMVASPIAKVRRSPQAADDDVVSALIAGVPTRPLKGLRVLDLGLLVSAPLATSVVRSLGAEVVALAHPLRASSRWYGPAATPVDLECQVGRREFAAFCRRSDVVIDNLSPTALVGPGLDPLELGARLHLRLPAFSSADERTSYRAYGFQTEALFGVGHMPIAPHATIVDAPHLALMDHAVGILAAALLVVSIESGVTGRAEFSHAEAASLLM